MHVIVKNLPKSQVELTITVSPLEQQPHLMAAAKRISEETKIPGFRPGFAPYDVVAAHVGDMKLLDLSLESVVRETFVKAVNEHTIKTVGMPEISFEKVAPKNDIVYKAVVSVVPTVTLPDLKTISVTEKIEPVADEKINDVLKELRGMHAVTVESVDPAGAQDQVTLDVDLLDGAVPLEGGQARDHIVNLDEPYYIPGFVEKLIGSRAGDELAFDLKFPKEHYQKMYADKDINFKVHVKKVSKRTLPELDEAFAKKVGVASIEELRTNISKNISDEHKRKSEEAAEIEMLRMIISKTSFGDIPENLIDSERRKLMNELMSNLQKHGISPDQYLADMKKTPEQLEAGFTDQAIERVKLGLVTYEIAEKENIAIAPKDLSDELNAIAESYKNNADALKRLKSPEVQESVLNSMRNRKVIEWLSEQLITHAA